MKIRRRRTQNYTLGVERLFQFLERKLKLKRAEALVAANAVASVIACLAANMIVFRLRGIVLVLYACVALTFGAICGALAGSIAEKLEPVFGKDDVYENTLDR